MIELFPKPPEPETMRTILAGLDKGDEFGESMGRLNREDIDGEVHKNLKMQQSAAYKNAYELLSGLIVLHGKIDFKEFNNLRRQYRLLRKDLMSAQKKHHALEYCLLKLRKELQSSEVLSRSTPGLHGDSRLASSQIASHSPEQHAQSPQVGDADATIDDLSLSPPASPLPQKPPPMRSRTADGALRVLGPRGEGQQEKDRREKKQPRSETNP